MFSTRQLGGARGQQDDGEVFRNLELAGAVPTGAVHQRRHGPCDVAADPYGADHRRAVPLFAQIRARPFFCPNRASSWNQISTRVALGRPAMWAASVQGKFF